MYSVIKRIVLYISKYTGLFWFSRQITKKGLRILCYHNFSKGDAIAWQPKLFIHPETFKKRLDYLEKKAFQVISLEEAVTYLEANQLPDYAVVITIDDGWQRTMQYADPLLKEMQYNYTVYLSSYYSKKESPVFNLVVQYLFWKSSEKLITEDLIELDFGKTANEQNDIIDTILKTGDLKLDNRERYELLIRLSEILKVDFSLVVDSKRFHLLTAGEIKAMDATGVDFQLHTHRHRWPLEENKAIDEIEVNRFFLLPLVTNELKHFCYPSGFWKPKQFGFLKKCKIKSAVTCESGFNYPKTNLFRLNRFLDGENILQVEFEAEMSGFLELLRIFRRFIHL